MLLGRVQSFNPIHDMQAQQDVTSDKLQAVNFKLQDRSLILGSAQMLVRSARTEQMRGRWKAADTQKRFVTHLERGVGMLGPHTTEYIKCRSWPSPFNGPLRDATSTTKFKLGDIEVSIMQSY